MHSWATISHHLEYKQEIAIPSHLKNEFNALSGVFYIADSLFDQFKNARETSIAELLTSVENDTFDLLQEINLDTLKAFIKWKLPERKEADDMEISSLVSILKGEKKGFQDISDILDNDKKLLTEYEQISGWYKKEFNSAEVIEILIFKPYWWVHFVNRQRLRM